MLVKSIMKSEANGSTSIEEIMKRNSQIVDEIFQRSFKDVECLNLSEEQKAKYHERLQDVFKQTYLKLQS